MSSNADVDRIAAEVSHYRDRLSLLKARIYSGRPSPDARLREFERALAGAERRLREARAVPPR